jgi:Spy/CpxP family protein refolding chaperone
MYKLFFWAILASVGLSAFSQGLVAVEVDSLILPSTRAGAVEVALLWQTLPSDPNVDLSKAPGQYFTMKMQNLTDNLNLTDDQRTKIKPIVEQERGEVGAACFTPTIPKKERIKRWEKIVLASDTKMKPILTTAQWQKLQDLRKGQKEDLKKIMEQEKN